MRGFLERVELRPAAVAPETSLAEACVELARSGLTAVAVVDGDRRVVGLFAEDELLRALFPGYLAQLRHTAAAPDDLAALQERAREAVRGRVADEMREPVTVELDASMTHVAELFLHREAGAVAVVERGRFRGMLAQTAFARLVLAELGVG